MKKLAAILSILLVAGLAHQSMVFAAATKEKKPAKKNFSVKKKHPGAAVAAATVAPVTPAATPKA